MTVIAPHALDAASGCGCAHCGLPMPGGAPRAEGAPLFCCAGCDAAWHALHACGLGRYYELQRAAGQRANRPGERSSHAWLDHAEFTSRHVAVLGDGRRRAELRVDGIKCGACLWLLEALPRVEPGVLSSRVDLGRSAIVLEWDPSATSLGTVARRIASLGYGLRPLGSRASREEWRRQDRRWLVDLGVAGAIAGNVMAIAFALYGAQFAWMDVATRQFLQWLSVGLGALAVAWPGRIYLRNAWDAIRTGTPHMDVPIALALLAGLIGGAAMTVAERPGVYLESVAMLVFLLLAGRFVQFRQQRRARHELELICALVPQTAWLVGHDGTVTEVPAEALEPGQLVRVPAGEAAPADGTLVTESARVDMQLLTGESRPVLVRNGAAVHAGVRATDSPLELVVTARGEDTRAAAIARLVDEASARRPPVVEFANRIAGKFTIAVIALAAFTGIAWWFIDPVRMPGVVIAMLVVTCPCALGLATPLTMVASLGKAARAGILVRGADVLERLSCSGTLVLDKTGTVTEGTMRVACSAGDPHAIGLAASVERASVHPVARAIASIRGGVTDGQHEAAACLRASGVTEVPGRGIRGLVEDATVAVGTRAFMAEVGARPNPWFEATAARMEQGALSPTFVAVDGRVRAVLGVGDPVRPDASDLVRDFASRGWDVRLCSGDLPSLASRVGRTIGLPEGASRGGCSPEDKLAFVRGVVRRPVIMVGDGLNDLPAMAAADVGIAVRQGAQATIDRADVTLAGGGLAQVAALVDGAARTMRTVRVNFAISIAYNVVGAALAATGTISPLIAAIMMPLSGLTVTAVALRMPRFDAPRGSEVAR